MTRRLCLTQPPQSSESRLRSPGSCRCGRSHRYHWATTGRESLALICQSRSPPAHSSKWTFPNGSSRHPPGSGPGEACLTSASPGRHCPPWQGFSQEAARLRPMPAPTCLATNACTHVLERIRRRPRGERGTSITQRCCMRPPTRGRSLLVHVGSVSFSPTLPTMHERIFSYSADPCNFACSWWSGGRLLSE